MKVEYLSYPYFKKFPIYGNPEVDLSIKHVKSQDRGDSANVFSFSMENHWGTHVDCPAHFFSEGQKIIDYSADFWIFNHPQVIHVELKAGQILSKDDFDNQINPDTDFLIFKSGWYEFRNSEDYSLKNPGLAPELGCWLRKTYPPIRAVGFDWVSISSFSNREIGRKAHKAFLDPDGEGNPILIVEDMDLSYSLNNLKQIIAAPLIIEGIDSAPCTIIGVFDD